MALLTFPPAPINGQYFPVSPLPGQYQYRWSAADATWRLEGVATGAIPGCYGDATTIPTFCVDAQGRITTITNTPAEFIKLNNPSAFNSYVWPNADGSASRILTTDGAGNLSWGSNGVTSVDVSGGATGLTFTGGPVTSSGTITMSGVLGIANGGTGVTTGVVTSVTAGTGIGVPSGTGAVTINNTGVISVDGGTTGLTPVAATTGAVSLGGVLNLANGGTGQVTASASLTALLPSQTGNANKFLTTDGASASWGSPQFIQYDDISASFDGVAVAFPLTVGAVAKAPAPSTNIMVYLGGVAQTPGAGNAYTVAGSTITFNSAPFSGTSFYAVTIG